MDTADSMQICAAEAQGDLVSASLHSGGKHFKEPNEPPWKRAIKLFPREIHKTISLCCLVQSVEMGLGPVIALII